MSGFKEYLKNKTDLKEKVVYRDKPEIVYKDEEINKIIDEMKLNLDDILMWYFVINEKDRPLIYEEVEKLKKVVDNILFKIRNKDYIE